MQRKVKMGIAMASLAALAAGPASADSSRNLRPLSVDFQAGFDVPSLTASVDLKLANHLGFAVGIAGEYRLYLSGEEVRRGVIDMAREPRQEIHEELGPAELPAPLPAAIVVCAVVDSTMRVVDRRGGVREIDDYRIECRQLLTGRDLLVADGGAE